MTAFWQSTISRIYWRAAGSAYSWGAIRPQDPCQCEVTSCTRACRCTHVVNGNIKEALDLRSVKVHGLEWDAYLVSCADLA